ncbi:hypothetical protein GCK72_019738 [Caenorhabditis remanei]|uniref:Uncharacterized protein n=1 Tax=Caenorhabditis remanei TaxID=31234 RepID=A0A6A5GFC4_CAERE|nr:hypothetical protein GCK72_019738 [Caenorhabditis remanei]KAF1753182.1 hypothetical protein GCK72_019738 [Caenorhabditis remanei]
MECLYFRCLNWLCWFWNRRNHVSDGTLCSISCFGPLGWDSFSVDLEDNVGNEKSDEVYHPHPPPLVPGVICNENIDDDWSDEGGEAVEE